MRLEKQEIVEPFPIEDVFVNGLDRVEDYGHGLARFWLCAHECSGLRVVRARLIIPLTCAMVMNQDAARAMAKLYVAAKPLLH